ncbi:RagB/SusD family nutrient uptake outer membrane protein [uncultured Polaribacter sp.]|uniref:RagB/SusD family nutrient uptake outer membrane protein n=1 Tax=uncultured Polaribacter sp. TaxID=174711 RepID=UPI0026138C0B|nr:RagB/SusD family nutrient uptake outer membrane protein [uncultured Polaribacter sp.]
MKKYLKIVVISFGFLFTFSCEDYLDIAPEVEVSVEDVFENFENTQGFVEEMYALVVDYGTAGHTFQDYMFGDDSYHPQAWKASGQIDNGTLDFWFRNTLSYLGKNVRTGGTLGNTTHQTARGRPRVWRGSMDGIRKANLVIANEDLLVNLSQAERDVILGQAYFFRAFFHNEIMKFWGRFPHIQEVFSGEITIPRPETYREAALSVNEDYKRAIELLPLNWDNETYGQRTVGNNQARITKGTAYAFQGKNLLLAASPLMFFNNQPGINTYQYDVELAQMATDAFAEFLKLVDQGFYDFASAENYDAVFWKTPNGNMWPGISPGAREMVFGSPGGNIVENRRFMVTGIPRSIHGIGGGAVSNITHNYIQNNFGMANGLSIEEDLSGAFGEPTYNPLRPFDNRDPRFYKWIIVDGDRINASSNFQLFSDNGAGRPGRHRSNNSSITGYLHKKFLPIDDNGDLGTNSNGLFNQFNGRRYHMRVTDVYLMYAEALHVAQGARTAPASYPKTAEQIINEIRARVNVQNVHEDIVNDNNKFMDEIRRQRAIELSLEAHRWVDIRRWGVAHLDKYKVKTALDFDRSYTFFRESVLTTRVCEYPKQYWLPFEANQTQFYEGFPQNPGW